jgi:hypothetical protein
MTSNLPQYAQRNLGYVDVSTSVYPYPFTLIIPPDYESSIFLEFQNLNGINVYMYPDTSEQFLYTGPFHVTKNIDIVCKFEITENAVDGFQSINLINNITNENIVTCTLTVRR